MVDPYTDAPLSGSLERVTTCTELDDLLATFLVQNCPSASNGNRNNNNVPENVPENPDFIQNSQTGQDVDIVNGDNEDLDGVPEFLEFSQNKQGNTQDCLPVVNSDNNNESNEVLHSPTTTPKSQLDMKCVMALPLLSNIDLEAWLKSADDPTDDGYNL